MYDPVLSDDGRHVAFTSPDSHLVDEDNNDSMDMFVKTIPGDSFYRASVSSSRVEANNQTTAGDISGDGRMITFSADANNLSSGDGFQTRDIFVHDRQTRTTYLVSQGGSGPGAQRPPPDVESPNECSDLGVCIQPTPVPGLRHRGRGS